MLYRLVLALFMSAALAVPAWAQSAGAPRLDPHGNPLGPTLPAFKPLPTREGYVPWSLLAQVRDKPFRDTVVPEFSAAVKRLHGQRIRLEGFMTPLQAGERHTHFLISGQPSTCFFCLPGGPAEIVEVRVRRPLAFSLEPIRLEGKLAVLEDDPQGLYYRLNDGEVVP
jgi:hypothetical protein